MNIIIPNVDDSMKWAYGSDFAGVQFIGRRSINIENIPEIDSEHLGKSLIVINPRSLDADADSTQWNEMLNQITESINIWWHIGGNLSWNYDAEEIEEQRKQRGLSNLKFPEESKVLLIPYSMGTRTSPWDHIIQNFVQTANTHERLPEDISSFLSELDRHANTAKNHYYGFQPLKKILADIFPVFLDIQTHLKDPAAMPLENVTALGIDVPDEEWLDHFYRELIEDEFLSDADDIPAKEQVQAAFDFLEKLKGKQKPAIEKRDLANLKCVFQLLNAQPETEGVSP